MSKVGSHELSTNGKGSKKTTTAKAKSQQGSGGGRKPGGMVTFVTSPGGTVRQKYVHPDNADNSDGSNRKRKYQGAAIVSASADTLALGEQQSALIHDIQSEKLKVRGLERRMTALEKASIDHIPKLQDIITQREIEKDAILQVLRTQPAFSSITFQSAASVPQPEWLAELRQKVEAAASAALKASAVHSLDYED